jgi:2-keto-4-pentenoate hydratase
MSASSCNGAGYILSDRASPLAAYPHMREVDGFLFVSGISSRRPDNSVEGVEIVDGTVRTDIRAQTRGVLENLKAILAVGGAGLENLVALTVYLVDMGEYSAFNEVYNEYFQAESGPTRTTVGVASLPGRSLRIEMTAVARRSRREAASQGEAATLTPALEALAGRLRDAQSRRTPCAPLGELSVEEAYLIQAANLARAGSRRTGRKIGLTSRAVQKWLGVDSPDFGGLTEAMLVGDGATAPLEALLQPRVEGEIAFVLGRDLPGPVVSAVDVLAATEYLLPSIEIIDSRIADWKITLTDTVADNASSARYVLGTSRRRLEGLDLRLIGMTLRKNGEIVSTGAGAACLENPLNAVAWLAERVSRLGDPLRAGEIILSGALGPVVPVGAGDHVEVTISGLGTASVRFG